MDKYEEFIARKRREYGAKFSDHSLDRRFVRYYNSGERIRVETCGMIVTGTVGVTTGWHPCFLLMRRRNSHGSSWTLGRRDTILAVKRGREYVLVEYESQSARDAQARNYGERIYWDYLERAALESRDYYLSKGDLENAQAMMDRSLFEALRGNDGD